MSQTITYTEANENVMNHIKQFGLFGSVLRTDFNKESDIDVLVEFAPGHVPGLAFFTMQDELSALFERYVDLNTPDFLSPYFREHDYATEAHMLVADKEFTEFKIGP